MAPESPQDLASYCFVPVGEGATFCLNQNCRTNHIGNGERIPVLPGEVFIMSDRTKAFKEPSSNSLLWGNGLYQNWIKYAIPVPEWIERFKLVKNQMDIDPVSSIDNHTLTNEAIFTQKVKNLPKCPKTQETRSSHIEAYQLFIGTRFFCKT